MDEYADIYYVEDARNAVRDHRAQGNPGGGRIFGTRPGRVVSAQPAPYRPPYASPAPAYQEPMYQQPMYQQPAYQQPMLAQPVYHQAMPSWYGQAVGSVLGRMTLGQVAELAAQAVAALMSLPQPPSPEVEGDPNTNIANLVIYQNELAKHAKRDEQLRTLGSLVARLVP